MLTLLVLEEHDSWPSPSLAATLWANGGYFSFKLAYLQACSYVMMLLCDNIFSLVKCKINV